MKVMSQFKEVCDRFDLLYILSRTELDDKNMLYTFKQMPCEHEDYFSKYFFTIPDDFTMSFGLSSFCTIDAALDRTSNAVSIVIVVPQTFNVYFL